MKANVCRNLILEPLYFHARCSNKKKKKKTPPIKRLILLTFQHNEFLSEQFNSFPIILLRTIEILTENF